MGEHVGHHEDGQDLRFRGRFAGAERLTPPRIDVPVSGSSFYGNPVSELPHPALPDISRFSLRDVKALVASWNALGVMSILSNAQASGEVNIQRAVVVGALAVASIFVTSDR